MKRENWEQLVKSRVNVATAEPLAAMSPSETGNVLGVMTGPQGRPSVCRNLMLSIRVLYAGPTGPLVAVRVNTSLFGSALLLVLANASP